jgi:glycosyltransferase involved in cell wall biosynthesis
VEHGRTGFVVPPDDPAALAEALRRVVADRALARRLGEGARARYRERFTPEVTARQIERVFERLAEARAARRAG